MEKEGFPVVTGAVVLIVVTVGIGVVVLTGAVVPVVVTVGRGVPAVVVPVGGNDAGIADVLVVMIPVVGEGVTEGVCGPPGGTFSDGNQVPRISSAIAATIISAAMLTRVTAPRYSIHQGFCVSSATVQTSIAPQY